MPVVRILVVAILAVIAACSSAKSTDVNPGSAEARDSAVVTPTVIPIDAAVAESLVARFEKPAGPMAARDAKLVYVIENRGSTEATLELDQLESAIFAIEVLDAKGKQIYTIPPGMPPANYQPRRAALAPGASRRFTVTLNVFSPELAAGTYSVRLRPENIQSETAAFTIR
ncbi:MAG TPA: hypothetical protein VIU61_09165 [Kofleriaceae bacterium]